MLQFAVETDLLVGELLLLPDLASGVEVGADKLTLAEDPGAGKRAHIPLLDAGGRRGLALNRRYDQTSLWEV
jgi:hypothetical protein